MRDYYLLIITRKIANPVSDFQKENFPESITCVLIDSYESPLKFRRIYDLEAYITSGEGISDVIEDITDPFLVYPINTGNQLFRNLVISQNDEMPYVVENAYL